MFGQKNRVQSYAMLRFKRMNEFYTNKMLQNKMRKLRFKIKQKQIIDAINIEREWLRHPLMESIRIRVQQTVEKEIKKQKFLCDKKDALMQTLFRITTFSLEEIFAKGPELKNALKKEGAFKNWTNICRLKKETVDAYKIRKKPILKIIHEQMWIIKDRLSKSELPLKKILSEQEAFDGTWKLEWQNNRIIAVKKDNEGNLLSKKNVRFGKVEPKTATAFHKDLHYIHTPRTKIAWGLYMEGEKLPFSVEAIESVNRDYKKNAIILQGYNPDYCIELTRMYNWPGSPTNTTSMMDGIIFSLYKNKFPNIQAATTAIMPTYALSKSQIAGGMKKVYLIKKAKHIFAQRMIDGKCVFEHMTNRRLQEYSGGKIEKNHAEFPLLPIIEFIQPFRDPQSTALNEKILCEGWQNGS